MQARNHVEVQNFFFLLSSGRALMPILHSPLPAIALCFCADFLSVVDIVIEQSSVN